MNPEHDHEDEAVATPADFLTINIQEFNDFVPIDSNEDDFDLATILNDINKTDQGQKKEIVPLQNADVNIGPQLCKTKKIAIPQNAQNTPPCFNNANVWNFNQPQNVLFVPRMWFPNSTVTINYNFGPQNMK